MSYPFKDDEDVDDYLSHVDLSDKNKEKNCKEDDYLFNPHYVIADSHSGLDVAQAYLERIKDYVHGLILGHRERASQRAYHSNHLFASFHDRPPANRLQRFFSKRDGNSCHSGADDERNEQLTETVNTISLSLLDA